MAESMGSNLSRREFLTWPIPFLLWPKEALARDATQYRLEYRVDLGVLFDLLTFTLSGTVIEEIDRLAGTYRVRIAGEGAGVSNRVEAAGAIRDGRFVPVQTNSSHTLRGRESWLTLRYDHERGLAEYHSVGHTLLLGRRRQVDDVVRLPADGHVDDAVSASLNFAASRLEVDGEGFHRTLVVRRARPESEGPDDVSPTGYRVEIVPFRFRVSPDGPGGRLTSLIDLTRWSSWARANRPARVTFGPDRRMESVESSLILGSSLKVRLT